jgi:hypothetical protein
VLGQVGQRLQQAGALAARFAHADDAAAAGFHAGRADVFERVEAILVLTRLNYLAVELRRGVEIVVVVVQPGRLQRLCLRVAEHAQRGAGFQAETFHRADDFGDLDHVAILRAAPRRAHAKAARTGGLGGLGAFQHGVHAHQLLRLHARVVARGLRAVGAVFRATAGLDRQQRGYLHGVRVMLFAVHGLRAMHQLVERQRKQRGHFFARPVVANHSVGHGQLLWIGRRVCEQMRRQSTARGLFRLT